jgi:hypothetical protein
MMFVIKNLGKYQINGSIHSKDTRQKNQCHSVRLASVQNGASYSSIRIFNKLPLLIVHIHYDTIVLRNILKNVFLKSFCSVNEFVR